MSEGTSPPIRAAVVTGVLAFLLYTLTSPPGITWSHLGEDGAEFAAVGKVLGITHPTGYPLFTLLLRIVSLGARENAWRATLLSNLAGAFGVFLAALLFFEIARRVARPRPAQIGAVAAAVIFAVAPLWWSQSIIIEVYALHLCCTIGALWLALRVQGRPRFLWILAYLSGLALTHHLQFVLVIPSLLILVAVGWKAAIGAPVVQDETAMEPAPRRPSTAAILAPALLLFLLPITLYLALLVRSHHDPAFDWGNPESLKNLFWVMRGEQYRFRMFTSKEPEVLRRGLAFLGGKFPPQFGWTVLALALPGLALLARRAPAAFVALLLYAVIQVGFIVNYAIPDPDAYYLPLILVTAAWIGAGIAAIAGLASLRRWRPAAIGLLVLLLAPAALALPGHWKLLNLSKDSVAEDYGRDAVTSLPRGSLVLSDGDGRTFALWYKQTTLERSDLTILYRSLLVWPWYLDNVAERDTTFQLSARGRTLTETSRYVLMDNLPLRPVYLTFVDRWAGRNFRVHPESRLFRVMGLRRDPRPPDGPARWKAVDITTAANADYRLDPFTPGSRVAAGLFPGLGGGALYWGTLPLMIARPQAASGKPTVFTTARQDQAHASFPLAAEPTTQVCLLLDGGAIGHAYLRLGEARVHYTEGPSDTVEIHSYENVWDYAAESYEITLPENIVAWYGPKNQSLTVVPIATDPNRTPLSLEVTGEGPIGEFGEPAGYTLFAATQVLLPQRQSPAATKPPQ